VRVHATTNDCVTTRLKDGSKEEGEDDGCTAHRDFYLANKDDLCLNDALSSEAFWR
jgi:hypothetical protein